MIIVAPRTGPVIAGSCDHGVNTHTGGSRYVATGFAIEKARGAVELRFEKSKMKKTRGQGAGNTPTALTQPLPTTPEGGRAVQKPMAPDYRFHGRPAATSGCQPVMIMTVSVVD